MAKARAIVCYHNGQFTIKTLFYYHNSTIMVMFRPQCMWRHRSHLLAPLTNLTSNKDRTVGKKRGPIKWERVHQEAFDKIKQAITDDVMLSFPDFNKPFEIHTDASDVQLGCSMRNSKVRRANQN
jgi:RNase H-like domain found in reverse transcriptase